MTYDIGVVVVAILSAAVVAYAARGYRTRRISWCFRDPTMSMDQYRAERQELLRQLQASRTRKERR